MLPSVMLLVLFALETPDGAVEAWRGAHAEVGALGADAAAGCASGAPSIPTEHPWSLECRTERDGTFVAVQRYGSETHARTVQGAVGDPDGLMAWPSSMATDAVDVGIDVPWAEGTARLWVAIPADLPPQHRGGGQVRLVSMSLKGLDRTWLEATLPYLGLCAGAEAETLTLTLSEGGRQVEGGGDCVQRELSARATEDLVGGATVTVELLP